MIYPAPDKLDTLDSKYALVIVAAKRARQVKDGARRFVDSKSTNPLTVALEEIAKSEITLLQTGEPEELPTSVAAVPVLGGLVATSIDDEDLSHAEIDDPLAALLAVSDDMDDLDTEEVAAEESLDESDLHEEDDLDATAADPVDEDGRFDLADDDAGGEDAESDDPEIETEANDD